MLFARSVPFFSSECCMAFLVVSGKFGPVLTCISNVVCVRCFFFNGSPTFLVSQCDTELNACQINFVHFTDTSNHVIF